MPTFTGDQFANVIDGSAVSDEINGLEGNDTLNGLAGDDTLFSGLGDQEILNGNEGDDKIYVNSARALLNGGNGNDIYFLSGLGLAGEQSSIADLSGIDTVDLRDASFVTGSLE